MNAMRMNLRGDHDGARAGRAAASRRGARAFTMTELLVAVGMVALLTVAIGQIFRSISRMVGSGAALAEVDQLARSIERQLRDDFGALNSMFADETFIVIRMREIGDLNRNGVLDAGAGEVALYLTQEDRDADLRDGVAPYAAGSRAVTRRLDEMAFLATQPAGFTSHQSDSPKLPDQARVAAVSTQTARVYWGHGLLPAADPEFDPTESTSNIPLRQYIPSGLEEDSTTRNVGWGAAFGRPGRNEFASGWPLARQALLLYGGEVAGWRRSAGGAQLTAVTGDGREFAPLIRDRETLKRFTQPVSSLEQMWLGQTGDVVTEDDIVRELYLQSDPEERLISWGRVDICAQSARDVRRWLEGEAPGWRPNNTLQVFPFDATAYPFGGGALVELTPEQTARRVNSWLWRRVGAGESPPPPGYVDTPDGRLTWNLAGARSAVAGVLTRPLVEATAPYFDRGPRLEGLNDPQRARRQPGDALMDLHATIAPLCSSFEIAWSDGSTALRDIDLDGDGVAEFGQGDLLWFDISPAEPDRTVRARSTYTWFAGQNVGAGPRLRANDVRLRSYAPDAGGMFPNDFPEIDFRAMRITTGMERRLNREEGMTTFQGALENAFYNPDLTGGLPSQIPQGVASDEEYLAVWPFRVPNASGEFTGPWEKNLHIRVRLTLHDAQRRLPAGKQYEFIFRANPSNGR